MFARSCIFSTETSKNVWEDGGRKEIQICYDSDMFCCKIVVCDETGLVISNSLIDDKTVMNVSLKLQLHI